MKWLAFVVAIWLIAVSSNIWHYGTQDNAAPADCIIVLGAAVQGNEPTPVFAERIRHAVNLYQHGLAAKLIFTGGTGAGDSHAESSVARIFAQRLGIPATAIYSEANSHTTQQNLAEAAALMRQHSLHSAMVVSDPLHLKRAMWMAHDVGIAAVSSPTPTSMYRSLATQLPFLAREVYFIHHYALTGM
ncbi:YdcF family protein [Thiothrix subterranea]|uniref:YdcF family protein n=1 Tax=Thiothrix subterranea TaxID=2735563 RepID=UPI00192C423D|nr:YdcF family protein [Thiothrix subterranea]QQZ28118.1 YdcF family protein [Thiothrix subterranea]